MSRLSALTVLLWVLWAGSAFAQTGNEEAICRTDSRVFQCENWQDYPVGPITGSLLGHYKQGNWGTNGGATIVNVVGPTGALQHVLEHHYPPVTTGAGDGSAPGSLDTTLPGGARPEFYQRVYGKWVNYKWSTISTKPLIEIFQCFPNCATGEEDIFAFSSQFDNAGVSGPTAFPQSFTVPRIQMSNSGSASFPNNLWLQNVGSTTVTSVAGFANNPWFCLEIHVKYSSNATNGIVEGWIDGVKRFNYLATQTNDTVTPGATSIRLATTWNCFATGGGGGTCNTANNSDNHPDMWRYTANIVTSTAPIGCLGGAVTPPPPNAPSNLRLGMLMLGLAGVAAAIKLRRNPSGAR